jgi:hypothetical protein
MDNINRSSKKFGTFLCPYCFKPIEPDKVHFRCKSKLGQIKTVEVLQTDAAYKDFSTEQLKQVVERESLFLGEANDTKLADFWRSRGGEAAYQGKNSEWSNPVITPENAKFMVRGGKYEPDDTGFYSRVTDSFFGQETDVRLCPHCHNVLPVGYGRYDIKFIAIIGVTGSGKTVYLSQFLSKSDKLLLDINLIEKAHDYIPPEVIEKDRPLPKGTTKDQMKPPMTITVQERNGGNFKTLVLYDIAGENCADDERMTIYGGFIEHADGIILLLDPGQLRQIRQDMAGESEAQKPSVLTEAMFTAFQQNREGKDIIPIAITLSKCDKLSSIRKDTNIPESVKFTITQHSRMLPSDLHEEGPYEDDLKQLSGEVNSLIHACDPSFAANVSYTFKPVGYFAVSALGCETKPILLPIGKPVSAANGNDRKSVKEQMDTHKILSSFLELSKNDNELLEYCIKMAAEDPDSENYFLYDGTLPKEQDRLSQIDFIPGTDSAAQENQYFLMVKSNEISGRVYIQGTWYIIKYDLTSLPTDEPRTFRIGDPVWWLLTQMGVGRLRQPNMPPQAPRHFFSALMERFR